MLDPFAFLYKASEVDGGFFRMLKAKLLATPCSPASPWRVALYADEVVPGNQLSVHNARKVWVIYFSFLELGARHLSNELAWCPMLTEPSHDLKTASAGIPQVFAKGDRGLLRY